MKNLVVAAGLAVRAAIVSAMCPGLQRPVTGMLPVRDLIARAALQNLVLKMKYVDLNGVVTEREVEVISFTPEHVQVNCRLRDGKFRQFLISNIQEARWTGECFKPRNENARRARTSLKQPIYAKN